MKCEARTCGHHGSIDVRLDDGDDIRLDTPAGNQLTHEGKHFRR